MNNIEIKKPEKMSEFFDNRASSYDNHMKETVKSFDDFYISISKTITGTNEKISILDLGCGTGLEIQGIFNKCPNALITGMDVSEKMLSELTRKYEKYRDQIRLIKDSYLAANLGENKYNYAISVMTMHHLLHGIKQRVYENIRKSLKPGAVYIEGDYMVSTEKEKHLLTQYNMRASTFKTSENGSFHIDIPFSVETQTKLLLDAGFSEAKVIWREGEAAILLARV